MVEPKCALCGAKRSEHNGLWSLNGVLMCPKCYNVTRKEEREWQQRNKPKYYVRVKSHDMDMHKEFDTKEQAMTYARDMLNRFQEVCIGNKDPANYRG